MEILASSDLSLVFVPYSSFSIWVPKTNIHEPELSWCRLLLGIAESLISSPLRVCHVPLIGFSKEA
jgi:hypothetical protein